jgi:hypothetical protein
MSLKRRTAFSWCRGSTDSLTCRLHGWPFILSRYRDGCLDAARIEELKREREVLARAARVPIDQVLTPLAARGVDRIDDFF